MAFGKKVSQAKSDPPVKVLAKYDGTCWLCGEDIREGEDWIIYSDLYAGFIHTDCPI